jgi:hypothetical protein
MDVKLDPDFKDLLALLEEHCVEYLRIGGYGFGLHGYACATVDLDIGVRRSMKMRRNWPPVVPATSTIFMN